MLEKIKNHPADNALFCYSTDILADKDRTGAELYLDGVKADEVASSREKRLEFITLRHCVGEEAAQMVGSFHSLQEANRFLQEAAKTAPPAKDGADKYILYAEWENKHEALFRGYTAFAGNVYLTREMEHSTDIADRVITIREMYDAGLLKPSGISQENWEKKQTDVAKDPIGKEYMLSSLRHLQGVKQQFFKLVRQHENSKKPKVSLVPKKRQSPQQNYER